MINIKAQVSGRFRLKVYRSDGTLKKDTGWFDNLITNYGLNRMASSSDYLLYCHVGTNNTPPAYTDTSLAGFLHGAGANGSATHPHSTSNPTYRSIKKVYRFDAGEATGNISEVGISRKSSSGDLFSRALIVDSSDNPTTITILSDESLDVEY
ncbi:MAG: hypothetical protein DRH93_11690, partial [Deltaproteobacteria bacterium]